MVCQKGQVWQVVGGIGKGGLKVRSGKDLSSQELPGRLSVGALVLALEEEHGRLSYKLLSGSGPQNGWVSTKVQDKALLVETDDHWQQNKKDADARLRDLAHDTTQQSPANDLLQLYWRRFLQTVDNGMDTSKAMVQDEQSAREWKENTRMVYPRKGVGDSFGLQNAKTMQLPHQDQIHRTFDNFGADDDIEEMSLCGDCGLPLGNQVFAFSDTQGPCLHGECAALRLQQNNQRLEEERQQRIKALTDERREEYDIGWKVARIPRNVTCIRRLSQECADSANMYCLVLHTDPASQKTKVRVAPTLEPAAAMNLEYLSIALAVHRKDGREPWFSLDPPGKRANGGEDCSDKKMQVKNFEPAWLANTSVGEVLFQADYYLKEASMGEVEQPVAGMRDTYELSRGTSYGGDMEWSAREWFMIRKASVQRSNDGVLIPCVKMGVEARGQAEFYDGLELVGLRDAKETSKDHPMAKYAEEFTRNFELIAERKSVIFHLREVAKAAVLARYLIASKADMEEQWFNLYDESTSFPNSPMEVPQLWHERYHEVIKLKSGDLPLSKQAMRACAYGGVDLAVNPGGLYEHDGIPGPINDHIANYGQRAPYGGMIPAASAGKLAGVVRAGGTYTSAGAGPIGAPVGAPRKRQLNWRNRRGGGVRLTTPQMPKRLGLGFEPQTMLPVLPVQVVSPRSTQLSAPGTLPSLSMGMTSPPVAVAGTVQAVQARGVDLNLDKFCLIEADSAYEEAVAFDWGACLLSLQENSASLLDDFWASVDGKRSSSLPCEDQGKSLLQTIFNPHQSDRREEGDQFIPPSTRFSHVQGLIDLVADEDSFRQRRMDVFCSPNFERNHPGFLFPRAWASIVEVADEQDGEIVNRHSNMNAIVDHKLTIAALKSLIPKFDKYTEDGTRFRIYSVGSLEVRTIQECDVAEVIGAVFSKSSSIQNSIETQESWRSHGQSKVAKVSLYVERCEPNFGYFVVLETIEGNSTVTYLPNQGAARWEWNPIDLDQRRSLAKLINSADCTRTPDLVTINDVRNSCSICENLLGTSSHSDRKDFAVGVCNLATKWLQTS